MAKKLERKYIARHNATENDKDIMNGENKLDRLEAAVEQLHRSATEENYSPVIAAVKEKRLMESFR